MVDQRDYADYRIHGRAYVVRHVGQEVALGVVGLGCSAERVLNLRAHALFVRMIGEFEYQHIIVAARDAIRRLLEQDQTHLDRIQVQMATAREFLIMLRLKDEKESDIFPYLSRIEKSLKEQSFSVKRADKEDIKRILAVYYEQNVTTEKFEDFDGERWIIPEI